MPKLGRERQKGRSPNFLKTQVGTRTLNVLDRPETIRLSLSFLSFPPWISKGDMLSALHFMSKSRPEF